MVLLLIVSVLVGTFLAEIVLRTFGGAWFNGQLRELSVSVHALRQADGDDAQQALMLRTGGLSLRFSLAAFVVLAGLFAIASSAPWVFHWSESQQTTYIVAASLAATVWWPLRNLGRSNKAVVPAVGHAYSALERCLHWIILKPAVVRQISFALERQFALPKWSNSITLAPHPSQTKNPADGAVYVCGLARSGTTVLLQILDQVDVFRSLHYTDMPFVLAPNLWKQITKFAPRQASTVERAHGDGIQIGFDSPEGFEEVFWRTVETSPPKTKCLNAETPSTEMLRYFADYRAIVANPRMAGKPSNRTPRRYLSKNNNNLLRLHSLCIDPTATVLLVYRDPVATARSLHRQHHRFCAVQSSDRFIRTYMNLLSHYEFGLDHRPFSFAAPVMDGTLLPDHPNYWLDYWNAVYCYVLESQYLRIHLVNHDALRAAPVKALNTIFDAVSIQGDAASLSLQINTISASAGTEEFSPALLQRAEATHRALLASSKNLL
jgi:hypothetical protein